MSAEMTVEGMISVFMKIRKVYADEFGRMLGNETYSPNETGLCRPKIRRKIRPAITGEIVTGRSIRRSLRGFPKRILQIWPIQWRRFLRDLKNGQKGRSHHYETENVKRGGSGEGADRTLVIRTGSAFYYLTGGQCTL